jgi:NAD(P)-dependent dehydrogenase (short-subunit alcohol dehydrogenase family)
LRTSAWRAIVNVSTMFADYGAAGLSLNGSSKAAINLLCATAARPTAICQPVKVFRTRRI